MNPIRQFFTCIRASGIRRGSAVKIVAMGRQRVFDAYDIGADTFVFERGISRHLDTRPSVLIVAKADLGRRSNGRVMTMSTGNHAVAAFPLLDGRFWRLSTLTGDRRSEVMMRRVLCANVVEGRLEISQREISTVNLVQCDQWLQDCAGFGMDAIQMLERNEETLAYYRSLGQEWRVKPLAWTEREIRVALAASRKRIATRLQYYHAVRGVHYLSFSEFRRFAELASSDPAEFINGLRELVGIYEGNRMSFARMPKYRGHHEIEFFGLKRGYGIERLVPEIERLMEAVALGRLGQLGVIQRSQELVALYESLLTRPEFADDTSREFIEAIYMHITGEVYSVVGEGTVPAFDDRRTALPGATFHDGRQTMHPGADERTEVLISNLRALMSKDEQLEYVNVYEIRSEDDAGRLGAGQTREIVYKTNRRPLENSLVQKRLSNARRGYSEYMLSRIGALRALGMTLSDLYMLLRRRPGMGRRGHAEYYIRRRCEGEPLDMVPANYFRSSEDASVEDREVILGLAALMGDAAAQNMAMKKYDPITQTPLFGVGKEIYEFEYDITRERIVPKRVSTCSIRGSFGWPSLEHTDDNLNAIANFYLGHYAHALKAFQRAHSVPMAELAERFMGGFEFRTHAMEWQLSVMREEFENFSPPMPSVYSFARKWAFVRWALERQDRRLPNIRRVFFDKVQVVETETAAENRDFNQQPQDN